MINNEQQLLGVGAVIGNYRVVRPMASGGFGNTYEVEHVRLHLRKCAKEFFMRGINQRVGDSVTVSVKENHATFEQMRAKFLHEAQRMAQLSNPHVVRVTDCFEQNDTAYYIMDLIDGQSLGEAMKSRDRAFSEAELWQMIPQVLSALRSVHAKGIYHLDLKPGNIMQDAEGHLWLIDFGASKQLSAGESMTLSTSTGLCYTPGFAPSELVQGATKYIGPWTDFYSLGATVYNLLTQQTPPEIAAVEEEGAAAFTFPKDISDNMRQLIRWLMQPRRKERPQTVDDIEQWLTNHSADASVKSDETPVVIPVVPLKAEAPVSVDQATVRQKSKQTVVGEKKSDKRPFTKKRILILALFALALALLMLLLSGLLKRNEEYDNDDEYDNIEYPETPSEYENRPMNDKEDEDDLAYSFKEEAEKKEEVEAEKYFIDLVHSWDEMHNKKVFDDSENCPYAETVLFYGKTMSGLEAAETNQSFLLANPDYRQVSTNIKVTKISEKCVRCDFEKHTTLNGKSKMYPSYLILIDEYGGIWRIKEESDSVTDANLSKLSSPRHSGMNEL